ncbi:MAG: hypothetical protein FJ298_08250 [Planctomycetes bacterium]|nr:hypothetical protein [Planctomycetota bacterium]
MDSNTAQDLLHAALRWLHVGAAALWIGSAFAFGTVRRALERSSDAAARRRTALATYPALLGWLRWGAAYAWMLGFVLLFLVYYRAALLLDAPELDPSHVQRLLQIDGRPTSRAWIPGFLALLAAFPLYELCVRFLRGTLALWLGLPLWFALAIGLSCVLESESGFSNRAVFVHIAAYLATAMAANVWIRIWPAERAALLALAAGEQPDAAALAVSRQRQRHNAAMALSVLLLMLSPHHTSLYSDTPWPWPWVAAVALCLGFALAELLSKLSDRFSAQ